MLVRLDSAHDAFETLVALRQAEKVSYIVKWNPRKQDLIAWRDQVFSQGEVSEPRKGKRVGIIVARVCKEIDGQSFYFTKVVRVIDRTIDKHGQYLLTPDIKLEGWWTNLDLPSSKIIRTLL